MKQWLIALQFLKNYFFIYSSNLDNISICWVLEFDLIRTNRNDQQVDFCG